MKPFSAVPAGLDLFLGLIAVLLVFAVLFWVARWAWWPSRKLPGNRLRHQRIRLHLRLHPGRGHATVAELFWHWSRFASWRLSGKTRPSVPAWARWRDPDTHSVFAGRAHYRHGVRVPVEEHVLVMSPPRKGKTAWLAFALMRYPGPAVCTSVKDDLFTLTSGIRAASGPVHVFNPEGYGGWPSTLAWNPVAGCQFEQVAFRRAEALTHAVSVQGTDDGSFWQAKASQMFVALFHAAALLDGDLRMVARWVFTDDTQAREALARHGAHQMAASLLELHNAPAEKTASVFRMVMTNALAFMSDPMLAQSVLPHAGTGFDIGEFIASGATLYLIATGDQEQSPLAPLFACLVNEIKYQATLMAQASRGGRLDPPLGLFLDEVTQIAPVPLNKWLASTGGMGIQIFPVVHGEAQLRERWGDNGAQVIMDTCGAKMFFPGITDPATLDMAAKVCGQVSLKQKGLTGEDYYSQFDIIDPAMARELPKGRALVIRGGLSPVIVTTPRAWRAPEYRAARRRHQTIAALVPAAAYRSVAEAVPAGVLPEEPVLEPAGVQPGDGGDYPWSTG
jgi:type IV secretory pathway TraG/TraD family ATPase VirD4